jgi:hypothetical protein
MDRVDPVDTDFIYFTEVILSKILASPNGYVFYNSVSPPLGNFANTLNAIDNDCRLFKVFNCELNPELSVIVPDIQVI